jgi:RNA polymerase sigma factor (sigma-70 family)
VIYPAETDGMGNSAIANFTFMTKTRYPVRLPYGSAPLTDGNLRNEVREQGIRKGSKFVGNDPVRLRLDWFKAVILPHEGALRGRMRRVLRQREDVEDVVAEVLTRAYATAQFDRITAGRSYLFQIARNLLIDEARRAKIVVLEEMAELELVADTISAERMLQARDQLRRLEAIVETLPPQCRRAFILRRVHDRPVKEIAEEMGLSVFTVDKHIAKATLKVMQALGQFEDARFDDPDTARPDHARPKAAGD